MVIVNNDFMACTKCKSAWAKRSDFLYDPTIKIVAYHVDFDDLDKGEFEFKHTTCGKILTLQTINFNDLYSGPSYTERKTGTDDCPGYCLDPAKLQPCEAECECARIREIIQVLLSPVC